METAGTKSSAAWRFRGYSSSSEHHERSEQQALHAPAASEHATRSHIPWACVVRDETVLAIAGADAPETVMSTARLLLNKEPAIGWDYFQQNWRGGFKGLRFHVYQKGLNQELIVWIFACVYDTARIQKQQAKSFLEKVVGITELWREHDADWKSGRDMACQELFGPVLQQRMQEVTYMGHSAVLDESFGLSSQIIATNRKLIKQSKQIGAVEEKPLDLISAHDISERVLLAQMEALNLEVLNQDLAEQELHEEELLVLKQMEQLNKVNEIPACQQKTTAASTGLSEDLDSTFGESESSDDEEEGTHGYDLQEHEIITVLQMVDDELSSCRSKPHGDALTLQTSTDTSSSRQGSKKKEVGFLLDKLEVELNKGQSQQVSKVLVANRGTPPRRLHGVEEDAVVGAPSKAEFLEGMLRDLEGDTWQKKARMITEVRVDSQLDEVASVLTDYPSSDQKTSSTCFFCRLFAPRKPTLV